MLPELGVNGFINDNVFLRCYCVLRTVQTVFVQGRDLYEVRFGARARTHYTYDIIMIIVIIILVWIYGSDLGC